MIELKICAMQEPLHDLIEFEELKFFTINLNRIEFIYECSSGLTCIKMDDGTKLYSSSNSYDYMSSYLSTKLDRLKN